MRKALLFPVMLIIVATVSCETLQTIHSSPQAEVLAAQNMFTTIVLELADLRAEGTFTMQQADAITLTISSCKAYLMKWSNDVIDGKPRPEAWSTFQTMLQHLTDLRGGT